GTTTGRPRRIGWLDLVIGRYAQRINGVTDFATRAGADRGPLVHIGGRGDIDGHGEPSG
ncbi:adenylosuccinate synthetase, partial [Actinoplanes philippinensis]|uniref:adenylosuccinate synthetase n=1 Tax=Actinoplanes philippinensis TaxID=35752 RepID=UPI003F4CE5F2